MEVGQVPDVGCSAKGKKNTKTLDPSEPTILLLLLLLLLLQGHRPLACFRLQEETSPLCTYMSSSTWRPLGLQFSFIFGGPSVVILYKILSRVCVSTEGVWIGEWIY
jgi:hypothetical protein